MQLQQPMMRVMMIMVMIAQNWDDGLGWIRDSAFVRSSSSLVGRVMVSAYYCCIVIARSRRRETDGLHRPTIYDRASLDSIHPSSPMTSRRRVGRISDDEQIFATVNPNPHGTFRTPRIYIYIYIYIYMHTSLHPTAPFLRKRRNRVVTGRAFRSHHRPGVDSMRGAGSNSIRESR